MIIDGRTIAGEVEAAVLRALSTLSRPPTLAIVVVGENPVIANFVRIKKRVAARLRVPVVERVFPDTVSAEELMRHIRVLGDDASVNGIILQLPLPAHLDTEAMLDAIPFGKDVDVLGRAAIAAFARGDALVLPPVAGAIQQILEHGAVAVSGRDTLVLGHGRLVGIPASILLRHNHARVTVIDQPIADLATHVRESEIIICGTGKPGLITPDMLRSDAVLIDAGTSESGGKIVGDADPRCAEVVRLFTPVPGGVGPIAVAMIFKNLCVLARSVS